jgi:hypothetical protein
MIERLKETKGINEGESSRRSRTILGMGRHRTVASMKMEDSVIRCWMAQPQREYGSEKGYRFSN